MCGKVLTSAFIINKVLNYELIPSFFSRISPAALLKRGLHFKFFPE